MRYLLRLVLLLSLVSSAAAHGFLWSIGTPGQATPNPRGLSKLNTEIDALRNPLITPNTCRGEPFSSTRTPLSVQLTSATQQLSLTFAISETAMHIGPCALYIGSTQISAADNCISSSKTPKCIPVPGSITNDMCLLTYTFTLSNLAAVKCTDCYLRWTWAATHISVYSPELFETCIDVTIGTPTIPPQAAVLTSTPVNNYKPIAPQAASIEPPILVVTPASTQNAYAIPPKAAASKKKCRKQQK